MSDRSLGRIPSPDDPRDWPIRSLLNVPALLPVLPERHVDSVLGRRLKDRFDQGETSSCVGQSTALVKRVQERRDLFRDVKIDPIRIWETAKLNDGLPDPGSNRGTYIRTALDLLRLSAPVVNRDPADPRMRIAAYYRISTVEEAQAAIFATGPIVVGASWFESWFDPEDGVLPEPDVEVGGHAFVLYGFDNATQTFLAANSWGTGWAEGGDFAVPYRFFGPGAPVDEAWKLVDALDLPKGG